MPNVALMRNEEKLAEAIRRSLPLLPAEARNQLLALLEPSSIAIISATLLIWAGSHFFGVGEIVDVLLLGVGFSLLGWLSSLVRKSCMGLLIARSMLAPRLTLTRPLGTLRRR